ncbi:phasin family protein [Burkholderia sp. WAC0059]|uniref:phasin family protein n=1 Tax=Burkholderia sp. WAC0059 TaxID=2066022 RepID=UPI0015E10C02|nr:phasin family protein [Burkholderia sp. WAC0059]
MSEDRTNALLELYKANTQFFEQLTGIAQQASQQWQSRSQQAVAAALAESEAELKALLDAKDLPALLASQTGIVRRRWEQHQGAIQAALQADAGNPAEVVTKLTEVFGAWHRRVSEVAGGTTFAAGAWSGYPNPFLQFWTSVANGSGAQGGRSGK